ncbi:protein ERGIC-53-like isoform X2 [Ascaphus truei]|uniref:protein ERGIC-53-like isoform X2 n=1 Tax=Ascaphus truei TaxID=8439 RepID=UPI003F5A1951
MREPPTARQSFRTSQRRSQSGGSFGKNLQPQVLGQVSYYTCTNKTDAIPGPDEVRLVPSLRNRGGSVWTRHSASFPHWEVEVSIRITGHGRMGAEGLAVWFTRERGESGSVYGSADLWDGVGVVFDTYDNDLQGNNPAIIVVGNNGKLHYDHATDGATQALGYCIRNFRNTVRPFRARISYYKRTLRVYVYTGTSPNDALYELCTEVKNMVIPSSGYFGISAATSALAADDHDVLSFLTYSLSETWTESPAAQIPDAEKDKFLKEFDQFQKELERHVEDYKKQHPELSSRDEGVFESDSQRELDMVLTGQSRVLQELSLLKERLSMTLGEQQRRRDVLTRAGANQTTTVKKEHVHSTLEVVLNGNIDLLSMVQELKADVLKMSAKAKALYPVSGAVTPKPSGLPDVQEDFSRIKRSLQSLVKTSASAHRPQCPTHPAVHACVSTTVFLLFLLIQTVCSIYYLLHRSRKDSASKKFY